MIQVTSLAFQKAKHWNFKYLWHRIYIHTLLTVDIFRTKTECMCNLTYLDVCLFLLHSEKSLLQGVFTILSAKWSLVELME